MVPDSRYFQQSITALLLLLYCHIAIAAATSVSDKSAAPATTPIKVSISITGIKDELKANALSYLELKKKLDDPHFTIAWLQQLHKKAKKNIKDALQPFGYYQATVNSTLNKTTENHWHAQYSVIPGVPVKISNVTIIIDGPGKNDTKVQALIAAFTIHKSAILNHNQYETARDQLVQDIGRLGYSQIKVEQSKVLVDPQKNSADIHIHLISGQQYFLGEFHFHQDFLDNNLILAYTQDIKHSAPYSQEAILALYDALYRSGYFSSVDIQPDFNNVIEQHVPINVTLKPANRHKFTLGAGYDTEIEANVSFRWQHRRLNHQGHYSEVMSKLSSKKSTFGGAYWIPVKDPRTDKIGIIPKFETEDTDSTDRDTFDLATGYWFNWKSWETTIFSEYKYEHFTSGQEPRTTTELLSLGFRFERSNYEQALFPRKGWTLYAESRFANSDVLSDIDYFRVHLKARLLLPVRNKGRLLLRAELGLAETSDFDSYPSSLRFYAGGDQSVRGYKWKALGPKNDQGDVIGGRNVFTSSIEYNHQIAEKWLSAVFIDAGNAYNEQLDKLYYGAGFGARWIAPFGLIRADLGFPLKSDDDIDEDNVQLYFGFEVNL